MRFDPKTVKRYQPIDYCEMPSIMVSEADYDQLLALYEAEKQAHKDDIREMQREMRDVAAEARWAERNEETW